MEIMNRPTVAKATQTATFISNRVNGTFVTLLGTYKDLMAIVHANRDGLTAEQIYAALGETDTATLKLAAILIKSICNKVKAGTITDAIPEATITLPS